MKVGDLVAYVEEIIDPEVGGGSAFTGNYY